MTKQATAYFFIIILLSVSILANVSNDELDEMLEICEANQAFADEDINDPTNLSLRKCLIREARGLLTCNAGPADLDEESCLGAAEAPLTKTRNRGWPGGMSFLTPLPSFMDIACKGAFPFKCNASAQFRAVTGICNNLQNQLWGAASTKVRRFIGANYADRKEEPRGGWESSFNHCVTGRLGGHSIKKRRGCKTKPKALLPNPRFVSFKLMRSSHSRSSSEGSHDLDPEATHLFVQFGQYLCHDISLFPEEELEKNCCDMPNQDGCFPIQVPCDDPHFLKPEFKPRKIKLDNHKAAIKEESFPSFLEGVNRKSINRMIANDKRLDNSSNGTSNRFLNFPTNFLSYSEPVGHFGYRSSFMHFPPPNKESRPKHPRGLPGMRSLSPFGSPSARYDPKLDAFDPPQTRGMARAKIQGLIEEDVRIMPAEMAIAQMRAAHTPEERGLVDPGYCLEFSRSVAFCQERSRGRDQMNGNTAFIDSSNIYGSEFSVFKKLRLFKRGFLKASQRGKNLPLQRGRGVSGDTRAAEMPSLAAFHTLFIREHNRVAFALRRFCCGGNDDLLFQRARRIVIAELQNVVYSQFLPKLLGPQTVELYRLGVSDRSRYDPTKNPTVRNAFSTAAFRFGHSMVWDNVSLVDGDGRRLREFRIRDTFFDDEIPTSMGGRGVDFTLNGMAAQPGGAYDMSVVEDLTNFLFVNGTGVTGADLIARNIQRGRDHGLPPYNEYRRYCGLPRACSWQSRPAEIPREAWEAIRDVYDNPEDIDLYVGGMAERPERGSMLGRTFTCLVAKQFFFLKFGDRYFYTHSAPQPQVVYPFTDDQIFNLRSRTLRDLICDNTMLKSFPQDPFRMNSRLRPCSDKVPLNMELFSDAYERRANFFFK